MELKPTLQLSTDQLAHAAWDMVKKHWKLLVGVPALIFIGYVFILYLVLKATDGNVGLGLILYIIGFVLFNMVYAASIKWSEQAFNGQTPDFNTGLEVAKKNWLGLFTTNLLTGIKVALWSILFILPGVYFGISYFFSSQIAAVEGIRHGKANQISRELVKRSGFLRTVGNFFAIYFAIYIFTILAYLVVGILSIIFGLIHANLAAIIIFAGLVIISLAAIAVFLIFFNFIYFAYKQEVGGLPKTEVVVEQA